MSGGRLNLGDRGALLALVGPALGVLALQLVVFPVPFAWSLSRVVLGLAWFMCVFSC